MNERYQDAIAENAMASIVTERNRHMNLIPGTYRIMLVTMLVAAFATGCNRPASQSNQASSGADTSNATGTTSSSGATGGGTGTTGSTGSTDSTGTGTTGSTASGTGATATPGTSESSKSSGATGATGSSESSGATGGTAGASGSSATGKAGAVVADSVITTKVKAALLADPDVKSTDISVETQNGEVMLSGFVRDKKQIDRAMNIARNVDGVKGVQNKLSIKSA